MNEPNREVVLLEIRHVCELIVRTLDQAVITVGGWLQEWLHWMQLRWKCSSRLQVWATRIRSISNLQSRTIDLIDWMKREQNAFSERAISIINSIDLPARPSPRWSEKLHNWWSSKRVHATARLFPIVCARVSQQMNVDIRVKLHQRNTNAHHVTIYANETNSLLWVLFRR